MNALQNRKIRLTAICLVAILQIAGVSIIPERFVSEFNFVIMFAYLLLGFLSIKWRQAAENIFLTTITAFFFMVTIFLGAALLTKAATFLWTIKIAIQLWGMLLITFGLPFFLTGFILRYIVLSILKLRK